MLKASPRRYANWLIDPWAGRPILNPMIASGTIGRVEAEALLEATGAELDALFKAAREVREARTDRTITYSRKVFLPLTNLCRDQCGYCVFARHVSDTRAHTMTPEEVVAVTRAGRQSDCKEALFSLGERPELRYPEHRAWLGSRGYQTTLEYLRDMCRLVLDETGLLPHANPGTLTEDEIAMLKPFNVSMGMMLESISERLLERGHAHYGCPDKVPAARLATLEAAGKHQVPFTTGILIGIGETRQERVAALLAIQEIHERYGQIQEVIVQNFRAKPETRFADRPEPDALEVARTAAVARLLFGPEINVQVPPNLTPDAHELFLEAGINDWGGISPVTRDYINPEKPWPQLRQLRSTTASAGFVLRERLAVYPEFIQWLHGPLLERARSFVGEDGLVLPSKEVW